VGIALGTPQGCFQGEIEGVCPSNVRGTPLAT